MIKGNKRHLVTIVHRRPSFLGGMARALDLGATLHGPFKVKVRVKPPKCAGRVNTYANIHAQSAEMQTRSVSHAWSEAFGYLSRGPSRREDDSRVLALRG